MHPLDALNPKISDEELVISYGCVITDLVTDNHTVSDVIRNDRIESHKWFTDLLLLIFEGYEEPLAYWDLAPKIVKELQEEVKKNEEYIQSYRNTVNFQERILDDYDPNAMIILAKAPEDIQERIKELDDNREEIWEWIHEEANLHNVTI